MAPAARKSLHHAAVYVVLGTEVQVDAKLRRERRIVLDLFAAQTGMVLSFVCQLLADVPGAAARGEACAAALAAGDSLSDALSKGGLLLPTQAQMLNLGLLGGNADQIMTEIAGDLMTEARQSLEDAVSRIEPTMVLVSSL